MSSLRRQEPVGNGLRRIACGKIEEAIRSLTRQPGQCAQAHDAVRSAQAMLALLEPDLPSAVLRRDRAILARLLEGLDEMNRPAQLLDRLDRRHKKAPADADLATAVKALRKRWSGRSKAGLSMSSRAGNFNPAIYRLVADMAELRGYAETWPTEKIDSAVLPRGLRRTYTRARRLAGQPTHANTLDERLTCITLLDRQLAAISKASPPMIKAHRKLLAKAIAGYTTLHLDGRLDKAIGQQLGKRYQDEPAQARALAQEAAADLTQALAESPAALTHRLNVYWSIWRREG